MSNYIYKMFDKNNTVIYVGKTIDVDQRIRQHMLDKDWFKTVDKIYYAECLNKTDMDIYEIYYINKLIPLHNKQLVNGIGFSIILDELNFVEYKKIIKPKSNVKQNNYGNTYCYNVGENFIESDNILKFYKNNPVLSKEWEELLKEKQFLRGKYHPCTFDRIEINKGLLIFIPFDKMGSYDISFERFIKDISNKNMLPLKYLSRDIIDYINYNLIDQMSKIKVTNMLKWNHAENKNADMEECFLGEKSKCIHSINNVIVDVFYKI